MLTDWFRPRVDRVAVPLGRALGSVGLSANAITVLGTVITGLACWCVATGRPVAGAWVLALGSIADTLDGAVATAMGTKSRAGAFLDSTLDRVSDGMLFAALAWLMAQEGNDLGLALALGTGVLAFMTSYIRGKAESLGLTCNVGFAERWLRILVMCFALVFHVVVPGLALLFVLSLQTVIQRFFHVYRKAQAAP
jgi:CDP-diacylglycerol--glycerol-3-phosphate 3-phosphatidyltransferase